MPWRLECRQTRLDVSDHDPIRPGLAISQPDGPPIVIPDDLAHELIEHDPEVGFEWRGGEHGEEDAAG